MDFDFEKRRRQLTKIVGRLIKLRSNLNTQRDVRAYTTACAGLLQNLWITRREIIDSHKKLGDRSAALRSAASLYALGIECVHGQRPYPIMVCRTKTSEDTVNGLAADSNELKSNVNTLTLLAQEGLGVVGDKIAVPKRLRPRGFCEAYGAVLAMCHECTLQGRKHSQNVLLGLSEPPIRDVTGVAPAVRKAFLTSRSTKSPTVKAGREWLLHGRKRPSATDGSTIVATWQRVRRMGRLFAIDSAPRNIGKRAMKAYAMLKEVKPHPIATRWLTSKRYNAHGVATVVTGPVRDTGVSTDTHSLCAVAASWAGQVAKEGEVSEEELWFLVSPGEVREGELWFLVSPGEDTASIPDTYHYNPSVIDDRSVEELQQAFLQRGSESLRRQARAAETRAQSRKRRADLIRTLRAIPEVTTEDSYAVGNCRPGTSDFRRLLDISVPRIAGRKLASKWRQASYASEALFSNVIRRLAPKS